VGSLLARVAGVKAAHQPHTQSVLRPITAACVECGRELEAETHRFGLGNTERAHEVFANAGENDALKVMLSAQPIQREPGTKNELVTA